jgi:branched-chain amino acid transport system substrate-binding protein
MTAVATGSLVTHQFKLPQHADNYVFRTAANDTIQAQMIVDEAVSRLHASRVAIFADSTNYGQLGREDLERALEKKGVRAAVVERFNVGNVDLSAQVERARKAGAETVLTYGIGPELAQIANEMARQNWRVPLVGSWTLAMASFIDSAGPNAEGARMPQTFIAEPTNSRHAAFLDAYRKSGAGTRIPVPPAAAQGYDAMLLLAAALRQAGSTDGPRIREALENLREPVDGVIARYQRPFSRTDHEAIDAPQTAVMGEIRGGRVVFADEEDRKRLAQR